MQTKIKKMSSKKFSHSKEKDIQFFLYKNRTNMAQNNNISLNLNVYNNKKNSRTNFINKQKELKNNFNKVNIGNNTGNSSNNINNNTKNVGNINAVKNTDVTNY